ncbi:histidine kinase [Celerinatantimonas sp. MCCC 1A17872]|uniref:histidine kinase n=1 Tax=Celerinatantimonas sp. MCCC 1A17872 TaxID=3177514 RepID=UPI0038BF7A22
MKQITPIRVMIEATLSASVFILLLGISTYLIYSKSIATLDAQIKIGLQSTVQAAATTIDGSLHQQITADTPPNSPIYATMAHQLEVIREASTDVRYIYTCILQDNVVKFVVNPSPQNDNDGDGKPDIPPRLMKVYKDAPNELIEALKHQSDGISPKAYRDRWGSFISAYAPFYNQKGQFVGVLAMDLELKHYYQRLQNIRDVFGKAKIIILFLGLIVGLVVWWLRSSDSHYVNRSYAEKQLYQQRLNRCAQVIQTLCKLNSYFYRRVDSYHREKQCVAWYEYGQSFVSRPTKVRSYQLDVWFKHLNRELKRYGALVHQFSAPQVIVAQFDGELILANFARIHSLIAHYQATPLAANTKVSEELLNDWLLTTYFYLDEQSRCHPDILWLTSPTQTEGVLSVNPDWRCTAIQLRTSFNSIHNAGVELIFGHKDYIELRWKVHKEDAA